MAIEFSFQSLPESCYEWPHVILGSGGEWGSPGVYSWPSVVYIICSGPNVRMFADDTKIFSVIQSFDDHLKLQGDIDRLLRWSHIWLLRFSIAKCKLMQIGNSAPFSYSMLDISTNLPLEIAEVEEMKNFGVWCTNDLKPSLQCRKAAAKAMQILGMLKRSNKLSFV